MTRDDIARLALAPELIVVALLEHDLEALTIALLVQHPVLEDPYEPATTATLRRARDVARAANHLRAALEAYRRDVLRAVTPVVSPDDLPF